MSKKKNSRQINLKQIGKALDGSRGCGQLQRRHAARAHRALNGVGAWWRPRRLSGGRPTANQPWWAMAVQQQAFWPAEGRGNARNPRQRAAASRASVAVATVVLSGNGQQVGGGARASRWGRESRRPNTKCGCGI